MTFPYAPACLRFYFLLVVIAFTQANAIAATFQYRTSAWSAEELRDPNCPEEISLTVSAHTVKTDIFDEYNMDIVALSGPSGAMQYRLPDEAGSNGSIYSQQGVVITSSLLCCSPSKPYAVTHLGAGSDKINYTGFSEKSQNYFLCKYVGNGGGKWSRGIAAKPPKTLGSPASQSVLTKPSASAHPTCSGSQPTDPTPSAVCGNPINAATGNKFQVETDFVGAENTGLDLTRSYNSHAPDETPFGAHWRSRWHNQLSVANNIVTVTRADGRVETFTSSAGVYTSEPDVRNVLRQIPGTGAPTAYTLTTADDDIETYSAEGKLLSITERSGRTTRLTYTDLGDLTTVTGPFGHVMTFAYGVGLDGNKRVTAVTAPDGGVYRYGYDARGNLVSVTYPDARARRYLYENVDYPNFLTGIIDEKGVRYATWAYDKEGRAISSQHAGGVDLTTVSYAETASTVTDARGNASTYALATQFDMVKPIGLTGAPLPALGGKAFTYDANGFLASKTDYNGNLTTYVHDARGNQVSRVEAAGTPLARTIATVWHPTLRLPTRITEPGRVTAFVYDARGNVLTKRIAAGTLTRTHSYTYNTLGQVLTATDPRGNVTRYAYDAKGNLASVTNALGHVTSFTSYDGAGRLLRWVDPNGLVTTLSYDLRGRVAARAEGALTTRYAYDAVGSLTRVTLPDGSFLSMTYDNARRLVGVTDALGNRIVYTLDATGNRTAERVFDPTNTLRQARSYTYDAVNRLLKAIGAQGQTTNYAYDPQGNQTAVSDPLAHTTAYTYDVLNRIAQATDPNAKTTQFAYDPLDHVTTVTDPRALRTIYGWTALDDQTSTTSPDTGATTRTYDAAGNVLTSTDARGKRTTYAYDALNRPTSITFADATSITLQYDIVVNGKGRLTKIIDPTGSTSYAYDANGHRTLKTQTIGALTRVTSYAYDAGGRIASVTYPSGKRVVYAYDAAGRVTGLMVGGQTLVSNVTYMPFGGVSGWTFGSGATYARTIDLSGRITGVALPANDNLALAYDAADRITRITDSATGFPKTFAYDALDRLTLYDIGVLRQSYAFDPNGNRTSATVQNWLRTDSVAYAYATASNRLVTLTGERDETFAYDASGNTVSHTGPSANYAFAYNARGRLAQATIGALSRTYGIDGLGQRVVKANPANTTEKTHFVYDEAGHLIGEYGATGALVQETVWLGDMPVAILQPTGNFFVAPDHLGAPHQITNAAGQVVWLWDHDPFGNGAPTGSLAYNLRFPGQYYDAETGLNYNYFRDYSARLGRYVQSDPIGLAGGTNSYAYVGGNPASGIDPTGLIQFVYHGYWCGPGWTGGMSESYNPDHIREYLRPFDGLDAACKSHDIRYYECRNAYPCDQLKRAQCMKGADRQLAKEATNQTNKGFIALSFASLGLWPTSPLLGTTVRPTRLLPLWGWMRYNSLQDPGTNAECGCLAGTSRRGD